MTIREFDEFFRSEQPRLVALGLALSGNLDTARDLAQETLTRAYRNWSRVREMECPEGWLRRVLTNLAIDEHRRAGKERMVIARLPPSSTSAVLEPASDAWWRAVRELPPRQRRVVALYYLEDCSTKTVSTMLKITQGTVKATLAAARRKLAESLKDSEDRNG